MYLKVRAKKMRDLPSRIDKAKNDLVVKVLNARGYDCSNDRKSMVLANNKLRKDNKKVVIDKENERLSKVGSYFIWEVQATVKIVDNKTGEEI